jgi:hypothetical protein
MELTQLAGLEQVRNFMLSLNLVSKGRGWATLSEIAEMTGVPEGYVSVNLKHLGERQYGSYLVLKRHRENVGSYEYRVTEKVKVCKISAI